MRPSPNLVVSHYKPSPLFPRQPTVMVPYLVAHVPAPSSFHRFGACDVLLRRRLHKWKPGEERRFEISRTFNTHCQSHFPQSVQSSACAAAGRGTHISMRVVSIMSRCCHALDQSVCCTKRILEHKVHTHNRTFTDP